jgi:hypothetical protein
LTNPVRYLIRDFTDVRCAVFFVFGIDSHFDSDTSPQQRQTGVEPILHDDITTHMAACVGGSISGLIVIFTTSVSLYQRDQMQDPGSDLEVVENMLVSFALFYTLLFTVLEPIRAGIKAVYVCFAQHPRSLSQAFPLIFHRLTRLSDSNMS